MSLNDDFRPGVTEPLLPPAESSLEVPAQDTGTKALWRSRFVRICLALFTFEIGLFLVVFPWTDYWHFNYFEEVIPAFQGLWEEPSFRGALTGLGLVNLYIACLQAVHSLRRS